jgi:hypothetical protein
MGSMIKLKYVLLLSSLFVLFLAVMLVNIDVVFLHFSTSSQGEVVHPNVIMLLGIAMLGVKYIPERKSELKL